MLSVATGRQSETLTKQLEDERVRLECLVEEVEHLQTKSFADKERAERLAKGQRDVLEKDLKDKMATAKKEVPHVLALWILGLTRGL